MGLMTYMRDQWLAAFDADYTYMGVKKMVQAQQAFAIISSIDT